LYGDICHLDFVMMSILEDECRQSR